MIGNGVQTLTVIACPGDVVSRQKALRRGRTVPFRCLTPPRWRRSFIFQGSEHQELGGIGRGLGKLAQRAQDRESLGFALLNRGRTDQQTVFCLAPSDRQRLNGFVRKVEYVQTPIESWKTSSPCTLRRAAFVVGVSDQRGIRHMIRALNGMFEDCTQCACQ